MSIILKIFAEPCFFFGHIYVSGNIWKRVLFFGEFTPFSKRRSFHGAVVVLLKLPCSVHCDQTDPVFVCPGYSSLPFRWFEYLKESKSVAAPVNLFNRVRLKRAEVSSDSSAWWLNAVWAALGVDVET